MPNSKPQTTADIRRPAARRENGRMKYSSPITSSDSTWPGLVPPFNNENSFLLGFRSMPA